MRVFEFHPGCVRRYHLVIAFDGSFFCGFQAQQTGGAVQNALEKPLHHIFGETFKIIGSSRTDSGVHARELHIHVDAPPEPDLPPEKLQNILHRLLPLSIKVLRCERAQDTFHARFSAVGKTYCYVFATEERPDPLLANYVFHAPRIRYPDRMARALEKVRGRHDFIAFSCTANPPVSDTVRTLFDTGFAQTNDRLFLTVTGEGFLYKMVRCMMGVLHRIGTGVYPESTVEEFLALKRRTPKVQIAPAHGLYLMQVHYAPLADWRQCRVAAPPYAN